MLRERGLPAPYAESRPLVIEELELDPPGEGEVLIEMSAAGLCHSDLSVISGVRPRPVPMALGHEASATVMKVGDGVTNLKPGDRVVLVFVPSCGTCMPCQEGRPALCEPGAEANGKGTLLTTESVLLNPNRHGGKPGKKDEVEKELKAMLGVKDIVWFKKGIEGDDTDGHIDDIVH